jgi:hypothetical protein
LSFRKEKKFRLTSSDIKYMKNSLLLSGMISLFPSRSINSAYFDTEYFNLFTDSEEGVLPRKKIRIRWYDNESSLRKETKISAIEGRYKLSEEFICPDFLNHFKSSLIDNDYGLLRPTLMVSYSREYFSLKGLRITFDTNIRYNNLRSNVSKPVSDEECVMEIKTAPEIGDDYIEKIVQHPTARFSKYARGMLKLQIQ